MAACTGPTLLGVDVIWSATLLAARRDLRRAVAIYAATTVRIRWRSRVKALNERREQLKAGIVASTNKRKKLTNQNEAADRVRGILGSFKMLQDDQVKKTQIKLMQAGIRTKDLAFFVIFARFVLPVVLGIGAVVADLLRRLFPGLGAVQAATALVAGTLVGSYKAPDIWLKNKVNKRSDAIRKGLPDALDLLVICAEAGLTVDAAFNRVAKELGKAYPELGDEFGLTAIELGFLNERRQAFENLANARRPRSGARRRHDHDPDREIRHAAGLGAARAVGRIPQRAHDARRGKGGAPAGDHDRAADPVHPADPVHRHPRPGGLLDQRQLLQQLSVQLSYGGRMPPRVRQDAAVIRLTLGTIDGLPVGSPHGTIDRDAAMTALHYRPVDHRRSWCSSSACCSAGS